MGLWSKNLILVWKNIDKYKLDNIKELQRCIYLCYVTILNDKGSSSFDNI